MGEVVSQTDAKGHQTSFGYDLLSRLTSRIEHDATGNVQNSWTWGNDAAKHNIGRLESMAAPGYSEGYEYDVHGRPIKRTINTGIGHVFDYTYNNFGALATLTYPTTTASPRFALSYEYQNGMLKYVKDANAPTTVFWTANDTDANGSIINETRGASLQTLSGFDAVTGLPDFIQSGAGGAIQNLEYTYDGVGNLTDREDVRASQAEHFTYDNLHRLTGIAGPDTGSVSYDARGNILSRSGNVSAGNSATIEWHSDGLAKKVTGPAGFSSEFFYGPDGQRWKQTASYGTGTDEETIYIGGLLEKVTRNGVITWKHYVAGGSGVAALQLRGSTNSLYYLTTDHLGSIDSLTTGGTTTNLSYGAFAQRRNATALSGNPTSGEWTAITNTTRHGYTLHEMLDNLNLIHMNGRVYDQLAGQFVSPDPFIDGPGSTQGWNRYAYVHNSPLSFVDPSGFASDTPDSQPKDGGSLVYNFVSAGFGMNVSSFQWLGSNAPLPLAFSSGTGWGSGSGAPQSPQYTVDANPNASISPNSGGNSTTPWQLGVQWLTGNGPRVQYFSDGDPLTQLLQQHSHIQDVRLLIANNIATGGSLSGRKNYYVGGVDGVGKYLKDYSTLLTFGQTGNLAVTYLGSYQLDYAVTGVLSDGTATVQFHVYNPSRISSATHPPIIGYTPWWEQNVAAPLNSFFQTGPLSKLSSILTGRRSSGGGHDRETTHSDEHPVPAYATWCLQRAN